MTPELQAEIAANLQEWVDTFGYDNSACTKHGDNCHVTICGSCGAEEHQQGMVTFFHEIHNHNPHDGLNQNGCLIYNTEEIIRKLTMPTVEVIPTSAENKAYKAAGKLDHWTRMAANMFGVVYDEVTDEQRKRAKVAGYFQAYSGPETKLDDFLTQQHSDEGEVK